MIVSYSRNFIFIKTKKTAGTTVEAVLAASCGPDDVVTLTTSNAGEDMSRNAENFFKHMTAEQACARIDPEFWKSAYKLTVERHPYEKAVSQAFYRFPKKNHSMEAFPKYLDRVVREGDYLGFHRWSIDGKVAVDEFIRQENLKPDLDRVGARLGIPIPAELPKMKTRTRADHRPAREILNDEQKRIIFERCEKEFEILGYER